MSQSIRLDVESSRGAQSLLIHRPGQRRLTEILRREHLPLNTRCGQRGLCDGCVIELLAGQLIHVATGEVVTATDAPQSVRGCEHQLTEGATARIRIPPRSLLAYEPQVVSEFRLNVPRAHDPLWQTVAVAPNGSLHDALARHTKRRRPIRFAPDLPTTIAEPAFATMEYRDDHWLVTRLAPAAPARPLGVAVDIGTTTVALLLVDLNNGAIVGRAADFNKQMHLGDDVATRIGLCTSDQGMVRQLQEAVVEQTIAPLLAAALRQANAKTPAGGTASNPATSGSSSGAASRAEEKTGIGGTASGPATTGPSSGAASRAADTGTLSADQVVCFSVTANTTMLHLFAGVDPSPLGVYPFQPAFLGHKVIQLPALGNVPVHLVPSAAAYIGADLTAGILASGLAYDDGPSLLVDVGTNGEIILKTGPQLLGCATAAGPAFEGAGLTHGIRATDGAIERLRFTTHPFGIQADVIGHAKPIGLCGSAYVDFLAGGRRAGLLTPTGRFVTDNPIGVADWLVTTGNGRALRVGRGQGQRDILVSETDTAHLLQSKAAIGAGILTLLARAGLAPGQIQRVYMAGGFGLHIDIANAIGCGLLPGFVPGQVQVVGNTALAGAYLALLDCGALDEIARIARQIEVVELNLDPEFESCYIDNLSLP